MSKKRYKDWIEYYNTKGLMTGSLKEVSGYSYGLTQITQNGLTDIIATARNFLSLKTTDILLDVGCGASLFTDKLVNHVGVTVGIDASSKMLDRANKESRFIKVEALADHLPFPNESFNKISCHSIFQYFPNHRYAAKVVAEMLRVIKSGGRCLIVDIPDITKKEDYISIKTHDSHNLRGFFIVKMVYKFDSKC